MSDFGSDLGFSCDTCGRSGASELDAAFWFSFPHHTGVTGHRCDQCGPKEVIKPAEWITAVANPRRLICTRCKTGDRLIPDGLTAVLQSRHVNVFARKHNQCKAT